MYKIKCRIYYDKKTGESLVITSETELDKLQSKEEDMNIYPNLKGRDINSVDFIELEYGQQAVIFNNFKSCKVNVMSKQLEVQYCTEEELNEVKNNSEKAHTITDRISNISMYISQDEIMISQIEDLIIQNEVNKIMGGIL